jgi:UDP-2-acetamido-2,6-beta-L-arabino-hexul-4-ose reductase
MLISSSIQAVLDNPYGKSKKAGEDLLFAYSKETGAKVLVYRFHNVFGKWCRPNYNSAVATFCNNIANELPISVSDSKVTLNLIYIDDLVNEFINALGGNAHLKDNYCRVEPVYTASLGDIVELIKSFKDSRENRFVADMSNLFTNKLYSTYLSY